jgi:hypothetical protein
MFGSDSPKAVILAAKDPTQPPNVVLTRAKALSRSGELVRRCQALIDQRPFSLDNYSDILGEGAESEGAELGASRLMLALAG